jgi:predicted transcriptional regulator
MKTTVYTDGFEGWAKRARANAKILDEGKRAIRSKSITFESAAEMARLLTPARLLLVDCVRHSPRYRVTELAHDLKRNIAAVRRDVKALEKYGIIKSEHVKNPGHGRFKVVSAPAEIKIVAKL